VPNLLNRIASIFSPRKDVPANAIARTPRANQVAANAFTPAITTHTRVQPMQVTVAPAIQNPVAETPPVQNAALVYTAPQVQNDAPIFRGLFQNEPASANAPLSQDVRSLWGGVNPFLRRTS
jgi:hypothetical protein